MKHHCVYTLHFVCRFICLDIGLFPPSAYREQCLLLTCGHAVSETLLSVGVDEHLEELPKAVLNLDRQCDWIERHIGA